MRRGHGAAGAGERLTTAHIAIPERPDAHATDASADEHEEGQAEDVGARAVIEALLHLRVVLRLAARGAHSAKEGGSQRSFLGSGGGLAGEITVTNEIKCNN